MTPWLLQACLPASRPDATSRCVARGGVFDADACMTMMNASVRVPTLPPAESDPSQPERVLAAPADHAACPLTIGGAPETLLPFVGRGPTFDDTDSYSDRVLLVVYIG